MSFELLPKLPAVESLTAGSFFWGWLLDAGAGLPLGAGRGTLPTAFVYDDRYGGKCPYYNDKLEVDAETATHMAMIAEWIAVYQDNLRDVWLKFPEPERERMKNDILGCRNLPVREDFVEKARTFAAWARISGGFLIT